MSDADRVAAHFTRGDGSFLFARWGRRPAPVVFGTDEDGAEIFGEALRDVCALAGLETAAEDPELGANFMVFFCSDWAELKAVPHLAKLIPDLDKLTSVLAGAGANQYRIFGFDEAGAIRIALVLLRYDDDLRRVSARTLALSQSVQSLLLWSDRAFETESPLAMTEDGAALVKPWHAALLRAAYDPVLPGRADAASFALRLAARMDMGRG
ncbi:MAG: hypothetical protein AAF192_17320 [Pseudomonadota bacterium]